MRVLFTNGHGLNNAVLSSQLKDVASTVRILLLDGIGLPGVCRDGWAALQDAYDARRMV